MPRPSFALLLAPALLMLASQTALAGCQVPGGSAGMQAELVANLNAQRKAHGLPALKLNPALGKAAQGHACDNAGRGSISHESSDGSRLQHRLRRAGYAYRTASENTGRGFASGKRAVEWWMASPGHRHNILMAEVREIGVGIAMSSAPDSRLHWVIDMGASH